ncbi:MAG TPA: hypothetical protein VKX17_28290 [Planctomycetota bacterium]|nr:hypothetical protein [Planctomycetota bacterium]
MRKQSFLTSVLLLLSVSLCASEDDTTSLVIGVRRDISAQKTATTPAKHVWFKEKTSDAAFHNEAVAAAYALGAGKVQSGELDELKESIAAQKDRCVPEFVWMLNWKNCDNALTRRGAIAGLGICNPDTKVAGKPLAISAIFEPDEAARKASVELIKARKDTEAAKTLVTTWKASFDEGGVLADNETQRKATVAAMHDIGDKRVFEVLLWYDDGSARRFGLARPRRYRLDPQQQRRSTDQPAH